MEPIPTYLDKRKKDIRTATTESRKVSPMDRFIPTRTNDSSLSIKQQQITTNTKEEDLITKDLLDLEKCRRSSLVFYPLSTPTLYRGSLYNNLFPGQALSPQRRIISTTLSSLPNDATTSIFKERETTWMIPSIQGTTRKIDSSPNVILDISGEVDNFYLNILDCDENDNIVLGVGTSILTYNIRTKRSRCLYDIHSPNSIRYVSSVKWSLEDTHSSSTLLALGDSRGVLSVLTLRPSGGVSRLNISESVSTSYSWGRINCISWMDHNVVSFGSLRGNVAHKDIRQQPSRFILAFSPHKEEICGLKWSPKNEPYFATGSNDNTMKIWDKRKVKHNQPLYTMHHRAAVRAIDWCPWEKNLIASGGGTADKTLKLWDISSSTTSLDDNNNNNNNIMSCKLVKSMDTGAQVGSIVWSKHSRELIASQGYSTNTITLWNRDSYHKTLELSWHQSRVLNLALSSNGQTLCSVGGEFMCLWTLFDDCLPTLMHDEGNDTGLDSNRRFLTKTNKRFKLNTGYSIR